MTNQRHGFDNAAQVDPAARFLGVGFSPTDFDSIRHGLDLPSCSLSSLHAIIDIHSLLLLGGCPKAVEIVMLALTDASPMDSLVVQVSVPDSRCGRCELSITH